MLDISKWFQAEQESCLKSNRVNIRREKKEQKRQMIGPNVKDELVVDVDIMR